jgi:hypothetical protein
MNQKFNGTKDGRTNMSMGIPIRFEAEAAGFEIKIKRSTRHGTLDLDPPLVPRMFNSRARVTGVALLAQLPLFKRGPAIASALHETMMDERRLEAILKAARKKRC